MKDPLEKYKKHPENEKTNQLASNANLPPHTKSDQEEAKSISNLNQPTMDIDFESLQAEIKSQQQNQIIKDQPTRDVDFEALQGQLTKESDSFLQRNPKMKDEPTRDVNFEAIQLKHQKKPSKSESLKKDAPTEDVNFEDLQEERERQKNPRVVISPYTIDEEILGEGADAKVYLAFSDEQKTSLAGVAKVAKPGHESQLYKEIEFAKRIIGRKLTHENVVTFFRTGVTSLGLPFTIGEYLSPFPRPNLELEDAFCTIAKIADALNYLHRNRIFHRDIKPDNIKFSFYGFKIIPKLLDFGTITNQINDEQNAACSPYFAAPEIFLRIRGHSTEEPQFSRADVFSLGMTFLGLIGFNPYFAIVPDLEQRYPDVRDLIDRLIHIHRNDSKKFFQLIELHLKKDHKWNVSLQNSLGISASQRRDLQEQIVLLLKQLLHFTPEERPKPSHIVNQFESIFYNIYHIKIKDYLSNGCSLFPGGARSTEGKSLEENYTYPINSYSGYSPYHNTPIPVRYDVSTSYPAKLDPAGYPQYQPSHAPDQQYDPAAYYPGQKMVANINYPPQMPPPMPQEISPGYNLGSSVPKKSEPKRVQKNSFYQKDRPETSRLSKKIAPPGNFVAQNTSYPPLPNGEKLKILEDTTRRLKMPPMRPDQVTQEPPTSQFNLANQFHLSEEDSSRISLSSLTPSISKPILPEPATSQFKIPNQYKIPDEDSARINNALINSPPNKLKIDLYKKPSEVDETTRINYSLLNKKSGTGGGPLANPPSSHIKMDWAFSLKQNNLAKKGTERILPAITGNDKTTEGLASTKKTPSGLFQVNNKGTERISPRSPQPRIVSPKKTTERLSSKSQSSPAAAVPEKIVPPQNPPSKLNHPYPSMLKQQPKNKES